MLRAVFLVSIHCSAGEARDVLQDAAGQDRFPM